MKLGTLEEQKKNWENWKESVFKLNPHLKEYEEPFIYWLWKNAALIVINDESFDTVDMMHHTWVAGRKYEKIGEIK